VCKSQERGLAKSSTQIKLVVTMTKLDVITYSVFLYFNNF